MLRLDTQLIAECTASAEEFMINYILRKTDDYESFVKDWLAIGGQKLLDESQEQLKELGYIS